MRVSALVSVVSAVGASPCPGFIECPTQADFPLPYDGTYPQSYPFSPGRRFPDGFVWGLGTAAYQIEGGYREGGRGASIWDTFSGANTVGMPGAQCKEAPCPVSKLMRAPGATGNVANDHFHKYKQDVAMMASMGLEVYRFSIAWPRIVPTGIYEDGVNSEGVEFYHSLIDEILAHGITPVITMYHWDLPQGLLDAGFDEQVIPTCDSRYKQGWFECRPGADGPVPLGLDSVVVAQFAKFASFLLKEFGGKVKTWVTFNEAWTFTALGSGAGKAPSVQPYLNASVWPYVAGHNVLLAHLRTVEVFREMQRTGVLSKDHTIGITNNQDWREPATSSPQDIAAAAVQLEGQLGWYADPIYGVDGLHDYPRSMKLSLPYLPTFTEEEKASFKANRPDFFGLNHYGTGFVSFDATTQSSSTNFPGLPMAKSVWLFQAGWGFRKLLNWVSKRYGRETPVYVTEGGFSVEAKTALEGKYDPGRTMYYYSYFSEMQKAIEEDGVNVMGYFAWSATDNYEWEMGYSERFGVIWNDFLFDVDPDAPNETTPVFDPHQGRVTGPCGMACVLGNGNLASQPGPRNAYQQTRHPKNTALWLQWVWETNTVVDPARFLASSIGGDICYGEGTYNGVSCALNSTLPGPAPLESYGCAMDSTPCAGKGKAAVPCCSSDLACAAITEDVSMCVPARGVVV